MEQRELVGHAIRGLTLPYEARVEKLAAMPNRPLAGQLDSLMNQLQLMRLVVLMAREQGYEKELVAYLQEGVPDEQVRAA